MLSVHEVSELCGVSIRALHHYDRIGLLSPDEVTPAGYRLYGETALSRLQQIMFYRELDFSLKEILALLSSPDYDRAAALNAQKELLGLKRERLGALIALIERTLTSENTLTEFEEFDMKEIEKAKQKYSEEARKRWGGTKEYAQSEEKQASRTAVQSNAMQAEADAIMDGFAELACGDPASPAAQAQVEKWQSHITQYYYECSKEILASLGEMYAGDPRFAENIDSHGAGTAQFMHDAIRIYCK